MQRDVHDPSYDPSYFVQDFPDDEELQAALNAARELSETIAPLLPGESALDAERRIDTAFHHLRVETDNNLDQFHKGERQGHKNQFIAEREQEIRTTYQVGIDNARRDDLKVGGQIAQEEEIQRFRKNIDSNEALKKILLDLSNLQAVRSEAISHAIQYTPPLSPQREPESPVLGGNEPSPPFKQQAEIPNQGENDSQAQSSGLVKARWETAEEFQARAARAETAKSRNQEEPKAEIDLRPKGPALSR